MPLSEHEQRLLEEMERNLYQHDADFVATVGNRRGKPNYTLIIVGILVAILGVGAVVAGVLLQQPILGVAGFVVMFVGALLAIAPSRGGSLPVEPSAAERAKAAARGGQPRGSRPAAPGASRGGFMDRMNERWDKRQDGDDNRS